ncbi:Leucyl-tRNA synthetase, mitochondrial, partial [Nowakowskiella sp. JEL0078]
MGWDAFGLPAENAAIDNGVLPSVWTMENISNMKHQLLGMDLSFDWDRVTGLCYQKEAAINWDPVDKTVLSNEQVDCEGRAERSGAIVEKRRLKQWFFRISKFAEELLSDLDHLDWPKNVKQLQRNWIGRSEGAEIDFAITDSDGRTFPHQSPITIFTTRPETIEHATFIAVSLEHPIFDGQYE